MTENTKKMRESDWLARLVLTSSEAEMLGGQLFDLQGYSEQSTNWRAADTHCHLHADCTHLVDRTSIFTCGQPTLEGMPAKGACTPLGPQMYRNSRCN